MIRSILLGAVAGLRSMTPLAVVSAAAARGRLPTDNGAPHLLARPAVASAAAAMAVAELVGDKLPSAPDRIIPPGMIARIATGAIAGASIAPRDQRLAAGAMGALGSIAASYLGFNARIRAMDRYGQVSTGLVEDAIAVGTAIWLVRGARSGRGWRW
ncbi:Uncharacterized membrane protein [Faunimonas pinastri]|uniref:Uncharacterized membrane protein n=1 Tax=Faunimonas pinastri TaxID=1855383 RepID=A0A1H9L9B3_9HYPH|nr:DUF4126 family protein [Faunimonas pinastri]SER07809.1 Uncharacterized membrane protein [Faunimonas pinastri]